MTAEEVCSGGGFQLEGTIGQLDAGQVMSGGQFEMTGGFWSGSSTILLGDLNGDGEVNLLDVAPFIDAISSGEYVIAADINQDGVVNLLDIDPFIQLLAG